MLRRILALLIGLSVAFGLRPGAAVAHAHSVHPAVSQAEHAGSASGSHQPTAKKQKPADCCCIACNLPVGMPSRESSGPLSLAHAIRFPPGPAPASIAAVLDPDPFPPRPALLG